LFDVFCVGDDYGFYDVFAFWFYVDDDCVSFEFCAFSHVPVVNGEEYLKLASKFHLRDHSVMDLPPTPTDTLPEASGVRLLGDHEQVSVGVPLGQSPPPQVPALLPYEPSRTSSREVPLSSLEPSLFLLGGLLRELLLRLMVEVPTFPQECMDWASFPALDILPSLPFPVGVLSLLPTAVRWEALPHLIADKLRTSKS